MSDQTHEGCPPLSVLLRLSDAEASPRERRTLTAHLWRCERCRARLAEIDTLATECVTALVSDDSASHDDARRFMAALHVHWRTQEAIPAKPATWQSMAIAFMAFIVGLQLLPSRTAVVRADDLLDRALQVEQTHRAGTTSPARVKLRWTPALLPATSRTAYPAISVVRPMSRGTIAEAWANADTLQMLTRHGIDWTRPSAIEGIQRWRNTLTARHEGVTEAGGLLTLRVKTNTSPLQMVELSVRSTTFDMVRAAFFIQAAGRLEVEALTDPVASPTPAEPSAAPTASNVRSIDLPGRDLLEQAELRARHALHATGLDRRGEVRVSITAARRVVVDGFASARERQALTRRLPPDQHLDLTLRSREHAPLRPYLVRSPRAGGPFDAWLNTTFGPHNTDAQNRFLRELETATVEAHEQIAALTVLARRYPATVVAGMPPATRASLQALLDQHYSDLNETLNRLVDKAAVMQGSTSGLPVARLRAPADWVARVDDAADEAETLSQLLRTLATLEDATAGETTREAFNAAVTQLWRVVNSPVPRSR